MLRQLVHDNTTAKVKLSFKSERLLKPRMPLMLFIVALPLPQRGCGTTFKYAHGAGNVAWQQPGAWPSHG